MRVLRYDRQRARCHSTGAYCWAGLSICRNADTESELNAASLSTHWYAGANRTHHSILGHQSFSVATGSLAAHACYAAVITWCPRRTLLNYSNVSRSRRPDELTKPSEQNVMDTISRNRTIAFMMLACVSWLLSGAQFHTLRLLSCFVLHHSESCLFLTKHSG